MRPVLAPGLRHRVHANVAETGAELLLQLRNLVGDQQRLSDRKQDPSPGLSNWDSRTRVLTHLCWEAVSLRKSRKTESCHANPSQVGAGAVPSVFSDG